MCSITCRHCISFKNKNSTCVRVHRVPKIVNHSLSLLTIEPSGIVLLRSDWMMLSKSAEDSKVPPHEVSRCSSVQFPIWGHEEWSVLGDETSKRLSSWAVAYDSRSIHGIFSIHYSEITDFVTQYSHTHVWRLPPVSMNTFSFTLVHHYLRELIWLEWVPGSDCTGRKKISGEGIKPTERWTDKDGERGEERMNSRIGFHHILVDNTIQYVKISRIKEIFGGVDCFC